MVETGKLHVSEQYLTYHPDDPRWTMAIRFPVLDAGGKVEAVGTFAVDITERKEAEAALQASEARLNAINAANPVPMNIVRVSDRKLLFVNEPYLRLFGLENIDLESFDRTTLYPDPAERDWYYRELEDGREVTDHETTLRRVDGTPVPVSVTSRQIVFQGEPAIVTAWADLTALRAAQAEVARSREALHQSEKLTALGALLAGVAHELNNPLSVVVGYSSMLKEIGCDPAMEARVEKIHAAAERCARIVRTFLAMARARPPRREPVALGEVVMGALDLAGYGLRSADIEVALDLPAGLAPVHGDADQLHQVVVNLVVNAQQALIGRAAPRRLSVRAWAEADEAVLEVADNGPGMEPDVASRAFEPFFTTKPQGVGTGVGLSVCHGIVAAHGGRIELDTARGEGARFRVHLPLVARGRAVAGGGRRHRAVGRRPGAGGGRRAGDRGAPQGAAGAGRPDGRHRVERPAGAGGARGRRRRRGGERPPDARHGRRGAGAGDPPALAGARRTASCSSPATRSAPTGRAARGARPADLREAARPRGAVGRAAPPHVRGWRRDDRRRASSWSTTSPTSGRCWPTISGCRASPSAPRPTPPSSTRGSPRRRPT